MPLSFQTWSLYLRGTSKLRVTTCDQPQLKCFCGKSHPEWLSSPQVVLTPGSRPNVLTNGCFNPQPALEDVTCSHLLLPRPDSCSQQIRITDSAGHIPSDPRLHPTILSVSSTFSQTKTCTICLLIGGLGSYTHRWRSHVEGGVIVAATRNCLSLYQGLLGPSLPHPAGTDGVDSVRILDTWHMSLEQPRH